MGSSVRSYAHHETVLALMGDDKVYDVVPPRADLSAPQGLDSTLTGTLSR